MISCLVVPPLLNQNRKPVKSGDGLQFYLWLQRQWFP